MFKNILQNLYTILVNINYILSKKKYHKFIFIHPPQSGGNTIDYFFKINFGLRNFKINNYKEFDVFNFSSENLKKYYLIYGHFPYEFTFRKNTENKFYYFTSIRNPKDRYLSNYYRNRRDVEKKGEKYMSLEEFLQLRLNQGLDNFYVRFFSSKNIYADSSIEINENHFLDSIQNLKKLNFIFFLDNMRKDILEFKKNFSLFFDMSLFFKLHKNKVSNSSYPKITSREKELLEKLTFYDSKLYEDIKKYKLRQAI